MSGDQLSTIKELAGALLDEVESLAEDGRPFAEPGGEGWEGFYEMVMAYEIRLIRRALRRARGNQRRAARLLRLKPTTLHNKIKLYNLGADGRAAPALGIAMTENRPQPCARSEPAP